MSAKPINIVGVEKIGKYTLSLTFDDGTRQDIDFGPFLTKSRHPNIRAYLEEERFNTFRLEHGELVWGDYELCFPMIDLYRNTLNKPDALEAVA